jgi:hypothetical protein
VSHEAKRISVLDKRIFARNALVDRDENLLFPQELQQVPQGTSLSLDNLSYAH